jgi:hypothetical protein
MSTEDYYSRSAGIDDVRRLSRNLVGVAKAFLCGSYFTVFSSEGGM